MSVNRCPVPDCVRRLKGGHSMCSIHEAALNPTMRQFLRESTLNALKSPWDNKVVEHYRKMLDAALDQVGAAEHQAALRAKSKLPKDWPFPGQV